MCRQLLTPQTSPWCVPSDRSLVARWPSLGQGIRAQGRPPIQDVPILTFYIKGGTNKCVHMSLEAAESYFLIVFLIPPNFKTSIWSCNGLVPQCLVASRLVIILAIFIYFCSVIFATLYKRRFSQPQESKNKDEFLNVSKILLTKIVCYLFKLSKFLWFLDICIKILSSTFSTSFPGEIPNSYLYKKRVIFDYYFLQSLSHFRGHL